MFNWVFKSAFVTSFVTKIYCLIEVIYPA